MAAEQQKANEESVPVELKEKVVKNVRIKYCETNVAMKVNSVLSAFAELDILQKNSTIKLKISGDGYKHSTRTGFIVLTFTMLEGESVHDSMHTWALSIANAAEQTVFLQEIAKDIAAALENILLHGYTFDNGNDVHFDVDLFACADQKFLCALLGLRGPTTTYFCPWCEIERKKKHDLLSKVPLRTMKRNNRLPHVLQLRFRNRV